MYFQYKPNSKAEPDFPEAGVELKSTPVKKKSKGLVSKERLVFNIINYKEEHKHTFRDSSFWQKNSLLLLMFYLHDEEKLDIDLIFKVIRLWRFPITDLKIIKDDWEKIVQKIRDGKAHEISEGDTLYLGACTKGGTRDTSRREQPFSSIMAQQRAFSLKSKYLNFIIEKSLKGDDELPEINKEYNKVLDEKPPRFEEPEGLYKRELKDSEAAVKSIDEYLEGETFEQYIIRRFSHYYGKSEQELIKELDLPKSAAKSRYYNIAKAIMGVKKKNIEEFEKADIVMKTIRLEEKGTIQQSMSFAQIQFKEIVNEAWEESYLFNTMTKRFFFVIFHKDENEELRLEKVMFWTMPAKDLEVAHEFWEDTKQKIINDDYHHFRKLADHNIFHVRPKGADSKDLMETPTGRMEKKKCYWLNSSYIKEVIS